MLGILSMPLKLFLIPTTSSCQWRRNGVNGCPQGSIKGGIYEALLYPCPSALESVIFVYWECIRNQESCTNKLDCDKPLFVKEP